MEIINVASELGYAASLLIGYYLGIIRADTKLILKMLKKKLA